MSLFRKAHRKHVVPTPHRKKSRGSGSRFHICRFEQMESRQLLSVSVPALHVGATYYQPHDGNDSVGSLLYISWNGGASGTHLTDLYIDTHKVASGTPDFTVQSPVPGDVFFHTAPSSIGGTMNGVPPSVLEWSGTVQPTITVSNDSTLLDIHFADTDFSASGRLVLKVNADIMESWSGGDAKRVVEGADFDGTSFEAVFSASHYETATVTGFFRNVYDNPQTTYELNLPDDNYDNTSAIFTAGMPASDPPEPVFTAGVLGSITQTPLPITLSGTVYEDLDVDNIHDSGEPGIPGVTLTLLSLDNGSYVSTGLTTTTDANGNYTFNNLAPDTYRVVETQPAGYLSVGDTPGTVNGATRGVVTTVNILSGINLDGGDDSIHNDFAEVKPANISGYVYVDANNNGHYDTGETPIAGVTLTLLDANGNLDRQDRHDRLDGLLPLRQSHARRLWRDRTATRRIPRRPRRCRHRGRHRPQPRRSDRRHPLEFRSIGAALRFRRVVAGEAQRLRLRQRQQQRRVRLGRDADFGRDAHAAGRQRQPDRKNGHHGCNGLLSLRQPRARHVRRERDAARRVPRWARRGRSGRWNGP